MTALQVIPVEGLGEVVAGDDLGAPLARLGRIELGDVLVVSSKVVSKALGLVVDRAHAAKGKEDIVLGESVRVVAERRAGDGHIMRVVEAVSGPVMMAAGVDASNTGATDALLLLPRDPDSAARALRRDVLRARGLAESTPLGVLISDTAGRPWRHGLTDFALGAAGMAVVEDHRGELDDDGRALSVTVRAVADELCAAADLVKGKSLRVPAAVIRGVPAHWLDGEDRGARALVRTGAGDWFAQGHIEAVRAALGAAPGTPEAAHVGVPAATSRHDSDSDRVARIIALSLLGHDEAGADVELGEEGAVAHVRVSATGDRTIGAVIARLHVAAYSEDLRCETDSEDPTLVRVVHLVHPSESR